MNERVRELAEQAGITTNLDTDFFAKDPNKWVDYFAEKFGELIVRECARSVNDWYQNHDKIHSDPMSYVLAHFGVEQ